MADPGPFNNAGLFHSAEYVSGDTCLYLENFAYRVANSSALNATTKAQVTMGFDYYLGRLGNTTAEEIASEVRLPPREQTTSLSCSLLCIYVTHDAARMNLKQLRSIALLRAELGFRFPIS